MSSEHLQDWLQYYRQKGQQVADIRTISGYDHPMAQISEQGLAELIDRITLLLNIRPEDRVLDIGSGAGLFTQELTPKASTVVAVDANYEMIRHSPSSVNRIVAVANELPLKSQSFDKILCHSVFQYFPNLYYAENVLAEMMRVLSKNGSFLVMDIPDLAKKQEYLAIKGEEPLGLKRLFYAKSWFDHLGPNVQLFDHSLTGYENAKYRFNVLYRK